MKTCKKLYHLSRAAAITSLFVVVLVGCSQWISEVSPTFVSGVAAAGAPISGNVYLKDSANHTIGPVQLGADGSFSFEVTGLTPPFYLLADGHIGSTNYLLYSVTTSSSGIANINPLTNAVVAAAAGGIDPASVYGDPSAHPVTKSDIDKAISDLQTLLSLILVEHDAGNVNPISDSFTADHTQLDAVFDIIAITVNTSGGGVPVVSVTDITGEVIAEASTGDLGDPATTTPLDPANIPKDVLSIGADRLKNTQNNDGGWEWQNPDTNPAIGVSATNPTGVTAQGLLDVYKISRNSVYLDACIKAYTRMVANSTNPSTSFPEPHRMRGADFAFLVDLSEVTENPTYANFAKTRYQAAINDNVIDPVTHTEITHTVTGFAQYLRDIRISQNLPALISWDINLYIRGVLALNRYFAGQGFDADAGSMAEVIYSSLYGTSAVFNLLNVTQNEYWLSHTGAIEAFTATGLHLDKRNSLMSALIASQTVAGNFVGVNGGSDVQTTAYAVMALLKVGGNAAHDAAKQGVKYLVTNQSVNGGWLEDITGTTENTEVTGEAIHAIDNFKTPSSSTTAPTVISTNPENTVTGIGVTRAVTATFSEAMDPSTITAANFTVTGPGGAPVLGGVTRVGNTATFTPAADLATGTVYTCTVTTGVKDLAGNAMAGNFVWSFTTVPGVTVGPSGDYQTIQAAIDAVQPGYTIKVSAGTYDKTINITKRVTIIGAGSSNAGTVLINTAAQGDFTNLPLVAGVTYGGYRPNVIISTSGIDSDNPVLLKDLQIKPGPNNGYPRPGIILQPGAAGAGYVASYSYLELNNVRVIGDLSGDSPGQADPHVLPVSTNARGITIDGRTSLNHFVVKNCEFSDMTYGMIFYNNVTHPSTVQDVEITNTTFAGNAVKGFYAEKLSDAIFTNVTVTGNGIVARSPYYWAWNNAGIDITLLYGNYKNLVFNNLTVTGNGIDSYAGAGLTVKARGTGNDDPSLLATLDGVMVSGGTFTGNTVGIRFGEVASPPAPAYWSPPAQSLQNTSPTNITVRGANVSGNPAGGDIVNYLNGVIIHN